MFGRRRKEVISLQIFAYECSGCGYCAKRCRRDVLKMVNNGSYSYATVSNPENCVGCGNCVKVCQTHAIELITE